MFSARDTLGVRIKNCFNVAGWEKIDIEERFGRAIIKEGGVNKVLQIYNTSKGEPYGAWADLQQKGKAAVIAHHGHCKEIMNANFILGV